MNTHPKYGGIREQFLSKWTHPNKQKPSVLRVYQVRNPREVFSSYQAYLWSLGGGGGAASAAASYGGASYGGSGGGGSLAGNGQVEVRRFHGTSLASGCDFAVDPTAKPCASPGCAVCSICCSRFDVALSGRGPLSGNSVAGQLPNQLRYGQGLYFSDTSSKSDDYSHASERRTQDLPGRGGAAQGTSRVRLMFLCRVAQGRALQCTASALDSQQVASLVQPRGPHDSIQGVTQDKGGGLNYDELVVYRSDAAVPSYLLVYQMP
mmetsp:Transcript_4059/g.8692  ORF Transcript_4059/g.8692 Transcript_4059/m.8692 type:complete len:264 (+) Transcript_4059:461-1252(+)